MSRDQNGWFEEIAKEYRYLQSTSQHQGLTLAQYEALIEGRANYREAGI